MSNELKELLKRCYASLDAAQYPGDQAMARMREYTLADIDIALRALEAAEPVAEIKRYNPYGYLLELPGEVRADMEEAEDGEYVEWEDYERLLHSASLTTQSEPVTPQPDKGPEAAILRDAIEKVRRDVCSCGWNPDGHDADCPAGVLQNALLATQAPQPAKGQVPEGWRTELEKIRDAIAAAPIDALGTGESPDCPPWPIRDEVVDGLTKLLAAAPAQEGGWDALAYATMRDEIEYWKRRALESEAALERIQEDLSPTHMGEPVLPKTLSNAKAPGPGEGIPPEVAAQKFDLIGHIDRWNISELKLGLQKHVPIYPTAWGSSAPVYVESTEGEQP